MNQGNMIDSAKRPRERNKVQNGGHINNGINSESKTAVIRLYCISRPSIIAERKDKGITCNV